MRAHLASFLRDSSAVACGTVRSLASRLKERNPQPVSAFGCGVKSARLYLRYSLDRVALPLDKNPLPQVRCGFDRNIVYLDRIFDSNAL